MSSVTDQAIDSPSNVEVPLPISSSRMSELFVALFSMCATSIISIMNVDRPLRISSDAPTLVNILSTKPTWALSAGTKEPACARIDSRAASPSESISLPYLALLSVEIFVFYPILCHLGRIRIAPPEQGVLALLLLVLNHRI